MIVQAVGKFNGETRAHKFLDIGRVLAQKPLAIDAEVSHVFEISNLRRAGGPIRGKDQVNCIKPAVGSILLHLPSHFHGSCSLARIVPGSLISVVVSLTAYFTMARAYAPS